MHHAKRFATTTGCFAVLALTVGCSPHTTSPAATQPQPSSRGQTEVAVAGFPDMSTYAKGDLAEFTVSGPPASGASVLTPDGMTCWLSSYPMPEYASVSCTEPRPDKGPGIWNVSAERNGETSVTQLRQMLIGPTPAALPARHVLYYESDVFCGVDDGGTTACRVGEHGFLLTPTETKVF